jgi:aminoacrylate hydrolase
LAFDATRHLATLRPPALIAAARDDVLVPCSMSEQLAAAIPGATLNVAPWGAHAINVTQPEAFNAMLLEFLAGPRASGPPQEP